MPIGKSLHIGLNAVDPKAYGGWDGQLTACEFDANDMQTIAKQAGFATKTLLTKAGTREASKKEIKNAAEELKSGDLFLLTYSGHGGQVPDKNNDEKQDHLDETWCLFDGELIDDELYELWSSFAAGVRIFVLSDSCHSGSAIKLSPGSPAPRDVPDEFAGLAKRGMPQEVVGKAYHAQQELYDGLQKSKPKTEDDVQASVLLISGCQDPQTSADGPFNGAFTGALLRVWNDGTFKGSYRTFHKQIQRLLPLTQQPNLMTLGGRSFARQHPFKI